MAAPTDPTGMPSVELLEGVHSFPCPYVFKVIGEDDRSFAARVVSVVRDELALEEDPPFSIRRTKSGRHLCVTLEPVVPRAQCVLDIYGLIQTLDGLVMVL